MPNIIIAAAMMRALISRMANDLQWDQLLCTSAVTFRVLIKLRSANSVPLSALEIVE